jgi:hypothetical protein
MRRVLYRVSILTVWLQGGWSEELRNGGRFFGRNTLEEERMWDIYIICR